MNFKQYEAYYWISRLGSFHAAARHLKTSQPAISARIRDLERSLGVSLFDRSERGVRLTAKGNELLQYAAQFMALAADIRQRVGTQEALFGRVRFGATNIHALTWLPSLIERVSRSHPGILVEVAVDTSETMQLLLERGLLDMAVIAGPIESAKLKTETVGRVANAFVASPKLNLPVEPMTARDLAQWAIISDRPGTHLHNATMEWFREEGAEPRQLHSCSHLPTRIHLATEGFGIALAARSAVHRELTQGSLELVATLRPAPHLDYFLAYSANGLSACDRIVAETALALLAQKPDLESYYASADDRRRRAGDRV
jgi:DNA-binding transcriptional LysR family regulator